ncbi:IucA/IucC family protein [Moraxella bovis]|uniref:Aerobactin synthase IucA n=1 Tax=Moraxella bovis TaxID=476 RepID=A0A378PZJ1_MORBO|nr:IucA/IucC family protein [Moraxella bovis]UYZ69454.1 siderophore biosynthesis protein [Moraxella bovis]UYZ72261.1 siderophore biosynthesis protein [Moraxella bovis]UZA15122.1 siderophore biosynthesis protein [Moraxella bovis]UZA26522.1 siderophore biosynthesis protein [Moraxella bovis]UZA38948.1 siderophore biosynthesis protein [Moraxella bovis]
MSNKQRDIERLSIQNLINAYCIETSRFKILQSSEQSDICRGCCEGHSALSLFLEPLKVRIVVPLLFVSVLGHHQIFDKIYIEQADGFVETNSLMLANLLLQDMLYWHSDKESININSVLSRWMDSSEKLQIILDSRQQKIDSIFKRKKLNFVDTEQALFCGHAMHPTPKNRIGFDNVQWKNFSPETNGCFKLHYWLVESSIYVEESESGLILERIKSDILNEIKIQKEYESEGYNNFRLIILHPWQAKYLQQKDIYKKLLTEEKLIDLGQMGDYYYATTSVRTVVNLNREWMFKLSLSVAITNSVRINLPKEGRRGLLANKIWHSQFGENIKNSYPMFDVVNDPAWNGVIVDGKIINETICIIRNNPFNEEDNITNLATLCQDHPSQKKNRLYHIIKNIRGSQKEFGVCLREISHKWFEEFLKISLIPMIDMYHNYGMVFEAHQQNCLIEIRDNFPYKFWVRDNQSFGYVTDYADELIDEYTDLIARAKCVVSIDFANSRFIYYFIGNTVFSLISSIAKTGFSTEENLLNILQEYIENLLKKYPNSKLLNTLLFSNQLPYKGNLLTRLHDLDELVAPVETQSIYVKIKNPIKHKEVNHV